MEIEQLMTKMNEFVAAKGWYEIDSKKPQTPRNIAISLALEASEVLEHFQWGETPLDKEALGSELADVTLYLLQLAYLCNIDLEESVLQKLDENYLRTWE